MRSEVRELIYEINERMEDMLETIFDERSDEVLIATARCIMELPDYSFLLSDLLQALYKRKPNLFKLYNSIGAYMSDSARLGLYESVHGDIIFEPSQNEKHI